MSRIKRRTDAITAAGLYSTANRGSCVVDVRATQFVSLILVSAMVGADATKINAHFSCQGKSEIAEACWKVSDR